MPAKRVNIYIPEDLLAELQSVAKANYVSRSTYIREAVGLRIQLDAYIAHQAVDKNSELNILKSIYHSQSYIKSIRRRRNGNVYLIVGI